MPNQPFTYNSLWHSLLGVYDAEEAQSIIRLVLDSKFGMTLTDIVCGGIGKLSDEQIVDLEHVVEKLKKGEPVQYVLGEAWFYGRCFHVEPGVLIPRPETEELCHMIIDDFDDYKSSTHNSQLTASTRCLTPIILDIGTGSGCIAITLALELQDAEVFAVDISNDALRIAKANAQSLGAKVDFRLHDILTPVYSKREYDIIVSNPPYIVEGERSAMRSNVLDYEPSLALFVPDNDPLRFYRAIAGFAAKSLAPQGSLYFEINPLFADELKDLLTEKGFKKISIVNDQFGKRRFIKACLTDSGL